MPYDHQKIEKKWQQKWAKAEVFKTKEDSAKPKFYALDMFPYPSGAGLHVGHSRGYTATDVIARVKMMRGFNVLHPMGWDAFGLPTENYAIKNKIHPSEATAMNIEIFKKQLFLLGFTYDWEREINTTDPKYYKWTQWAFLQMLKRGLAHESDEPVNWCPVDKTVLANEDLENGKCERCGSAVERKQMRQWVLKITNYADRLLYGLDKLTEWPESIKQMQKEWIGRSEGAEVVFKIVPPSPYEGEGGGEVRVFTTRPDTLFGATYMVLAPEHPLVSQITTKEQRIEVEKYVAVAKNKTETERGDETREKTGVFTGAYTVNPVNDEEIPIWVADYALMGYGTGAIMSVPAHDERDFAFAKKFNLPIKKVVVPPQPQVESECWSDDGVSVNSDFLNGLPTRKAKNDMISWLEEKGLGVRKIQYKLRDWVFSRQRYWGEPIPVVHCEKCGTVPLPEDQLPLELPKVEHYEPTGTGESPLAAIEDWVNTSCPKCGEPARRETNTMPQWAGSCWYYLRYMDSKNSTALVNPKKERYWSPVDLYVGGAEHATRHLIYARFWHKFFFDIGVVSGDEPFTRLYNVGLILAEDGRKMSKRWNNVINPDDMVAEYGADALRVYEMFIGPFNQPAAWSTNGLVGARRFLEKVSGLVSLISEKESEAVTRSLHQTIKKVTEDIDAFRFNTAVSQMMTFVNVVYEEKRITEDSLLKFVCILCPFAPHLANEIFESLGGEGFVEAGAWPEFDPELMREDEMTIAVQVNGKLRGSVIVPAEASEDEVKTAALGEENVKKYLAGKEIIKMIFVKGKLMNFVVGK